MPIEDRVGDDLHATWWFDAGGDQGVAQALLMDDQHVSSAPEPPNAADRHAAALHIARMVDHVLDGDDQQEAPQPGQRQEQPEHTVTEEMDDVRAEGAKAPDDAAGENELARIAMARPVQGAKRDATAEIGTLALDPWFRRQHENVGDRRPGPDDRRRILVGIGWETSDPEPLLVRRQLHAHPW